MGTASRPPKWIKPQLTRLVDEAPPGGGWVHEIKYDGYRMHARIDGGDIKLLTRTGLDWSHRYRRTIEALGSLKVKSAYLDGELCALVDRRRPRGVSRPESASITSNIPPQLPAPRGLLPDPVSRRSTLIAATAICSSETAS